MVLQGYPKRSGLPQTDVIMLKCSHHTLVFSLSLLIDLAQAKRRISSIIGAVVADAASLPLEWIYKDATMKVETG